MRAKCREGRAGVMAEPWMQVSEEAWNSDGMGAAISSCARFFRPSANNLINSKFLYLIYLINKRYVKQRHYAVGSETLDIRRV